MSNLTSFGMVAGALVLVGLGSIFINVPGVSAAGDPVLKLLLNEGSGTTAGDSSGNGNHGSLLNGPTWVTGKSGSALNFDGSNDSVYINVSSTINSVNTGVTVAAWVYRNNNPVSFQSVLSRQVGDTYFEHYYLGFENGRYRWFVNTNNGYSNYALGSTAPLGQWVHVVGTYDGSNARLYVNGVLDFTAPHSGTFPADATGIVIGANHNDATHNPDEVFNGRIDDINIYATALTPSEVIQLYENGSPAETIPPSVPTGLTATPASSSRINLSWTASTDNVAVTGYRIFRNGTAVATSATTTYQDTGLAANTAYGYSVAAFDGATNESARSNVVSATTLVATDTVPPSVPAGLTATPVSSSRIDLSWTASTDNVAVTGYRIFRAGTAIATSATTTYQDTGLAANTAYAYSVAAFDGATNESARSNAVSATTLAASATPSNVVHLPLNEGTGTTAADASGNGNNGALLNGPTWTTGQSGTALNFDGNNDTVYINNSSTINSVSNAVTVAVWVYRNASPSGWQSVVSRQVGDTYFEHYFLGFENGQYRWFVNTTNGYSDYTVGSASSLSQWIHLVGTYDGSNARLYVNGVLNFTRARSGTFPSDVTGIAIGAQHNDAARAPGELFSGRIDDARIYSNALTASEVTQLYQGSTGGGTDSPPTVSIASPSAGQTVNGVFGITATASDDLGVAGVQFRVDGSNSGPEDTVAPYAASIDTSAYTGGQHVLTAVARDTTGHSTVSASVNVTFENNTGNNINLMPLGDSLTHGYVYETSPNNDDGGYRRYLWEKIRANGFNDVNFVGSVSSGIPTMDRDHEGHGGWRTIDLATIMNSSLATHSPNTILLLIGTNDLAWGASSPQQTLNNLSSLVDQIHTARPTAKILLANNPGVRVNNDFPEITPQEISEFNAGLPSLINNRAAQGWQIALVDLYGQAGLNRTSNSNDYSQDGLHFSLAGYSKLADAWYAALYASPSDTVPPSVPTGLTATPVSSSRIDLSWTASTDNVAVTGYRIFRNGTAIATSTTTTYQNTGLAANTAYAYSVAAFDGATNESARSNVVSATTLVATDTIPPSVPTGLTATPISSSRIDLSWAASSDNVAVTGYRIFRGGTAIATIATTTYQDKGLAANTAYAYSVAAIDGATNESARSNVVSATTLPKGRPR